MTQPSGAEPRPFAAQARYVASYVALAILLAYQRTYEAIEAFGDAVGLFPHTRYLWYVLRHKYYVYRAGRALGLPRWRLLTHDATKFGPTEWFPYVRRFGSARGARTLRGWGSQGYMHTPGDDVAFDRAWVHHYTHPWNRHHWNAYVIRAGDSEAMADPDVVGMARPMPPTYAHEMAADHYGAGMAQGKPDIWAWWVANQHHITLHHSTRRHYLWAMRKLHDAGLITIPEHEVPYA